MKALIKLAKQREQVSSPDALDSLGRNGCRALNIDKLAENRPTLDRNIASAASISGVSVSSMHDSPLSHHQAYR